MIFHENLLLADDSHEVSYLIFFRKLGKMSQNVLSAAVVIGALRVNPRSTLQSVDLIICIMGNYSCILLSADFFKIPFFEKFFQEYLQSVKQFGSRSGLTFFWA